MIPSSSLIEHVSYLKGKVSHYDLASPGRGVSDRISHWAEYDYLNVAISVDHRHPFAAALNNTIRFDSINSTGGHGRLEGLLEGTANTSMNRTVYWYGVITFLRPMLVIFTYADTIWLLRLIYFILLVLVIIASAKKIDSMTSALYAVSLVCVNPVVYTANLTGIVSFFISVISILILLNSLESEDKFRKIFIATGLLTAFFEWFNTPIVTYGYLALFYLLTKQSSDQEQNKLKENFKSFAGHTCSWVLSYGGMIVFKWIITSIALGGDVFVDGLSRTLNDMTKEGNVPQGLWEATVLSIKMNVKQLEIVRLFHGRWLYLLAVLTFLIIGMVIHWTIKRHEYYLLLILVVSLCPFVWFVVFRGHSIIHYSVTYRSLGITIFAWLYVCIQWFQPIRDAIINKYKKQ